MHALTHLPLTALSDALDMLGIDGGCRGIRPVVPGLRCTGPAFTVRFRPVEPGEAGPAADYIDQVPPGSVIVIDNAGRLDCTVWGGLLTHYAIRRNLGGAVIDGCCRDTAEIARFRFPVFAAGSFLKSGKNRVVLQSCNVPVHIGGTTVHPGDLVCADQDGVLVIPNEHVEQVATLAGQVRDMEDRIGHEIRRGTELSVARKMHGYHRFGWRSQSE